VYLILDTGHIPKESAILKDTHVIESAAELPAVELVVAAGPIANHIRGSEILNRFDHPKDCIYMFGADNISMHDRHLGGRGVDHMVYIPLPGKPELNAHTAAAIFFYDRVNRQ
jgi:tRNA G18 (ribose-2'-O)-methylase SpoU